MPMRLKSIQYEVTQDAKNLLIGSIKPIDKHVYITKKINFPNTSLKKLKLNIFLPKNLIKNNMMWLER